MTAGRYQFRYIAQRLLDDRAEKAERAAAAQPYLDKGYTILAEEPQYGTDVLLADLVAADGSEVTTAHTETDPARWAVWLSKDERYFDTESGEEVDGEEVDWSTENHPDATRTRGTDTRTRCKPARSGHRSTCASTSTVPQWRSPRYSQPPEPPPRVKAPRTTLPQPCGWKPSPRNASVRNAARCGS